MRILLQPSSGKKAEEHFIETIENGVPLFGMKDQINTNEFKKLHGLNRYIVRVWGFVPDANNRRKEWEELERNDLVMFYAKKRFFYIAKVHLKIRNKELAKQWWSEDDEGRTWEFIYFIKEGKQIDIPYLPSILRKKDGTPYNKNHIIQGAILLDENNSFSMNEYLHINIGDLIEEESIEPSNEDIVSINKICQKVNSAEEADKMIKEISKSLENEPVRIRIRLAKALSRNPKFSRLIKEKNKYICEVCGQKPFIQKNGIPYAEAHHIYELAKTLIDNPNNMICVCSICHRVIHFGNEASFNERKQMRRIR